MYSWLDLAPWVLKRVPTSPSLISIGTNRGSLEIFDFAENMAIEGLGMLRGEERRREERRGGERGERRGGERRGEEGRGGEREVG